jgi:hypothetical protein
MPAFLEQVSKRAGLLEVGRIPQKIGRKTEKVGTISCDW